MKILMNHCLPVSPTQQQHISDSYWIRLLEFNFGVLEGVKWMLRIYDVPLLIKIISHNLLDNIMYVLYRENGFCNKNEHFW